MDTFTVITPYGLTAVLSPLRGTHHDMLTRPTRRLVDIVRRFNDILSDTLLEYGGREKPPITSIPATDKKFLLLHLFLHLNDFPDKIEFDYRYTPKGQKVEKVYHHVEEFGQSSIDGFPYVQPSVQFTRYEETQDSIVFEVGEEKYRVKLATGETELAIFRAHDSANMSSKAILALRKLFKYTLIGNQHQWMPFDFAKATYKEVAQVTHKISALDGDVLSYIQFKNPDETREDEAPMITLDALNIEDFLFGRLG